MKLNQLSFLVALDRHRHFGRAAEACSVTQPALSMQLRKLERELGVPLFDRERTPIEPTDVGRLVIDQARRVLDEAARLREVARGSGEVAGELRLGAIPTLGPYLLPAALPRLARRHPELRVQVEEMQTEMILQRVRGGELDAGLIATEAEGAGVEALPLFPEAFLGYLSESHPLYGAERLRVEDVRPDGLWLLAQGHCLRDQVLGLCGGRGEAPGGAGAFRFESGNLETLRRLVEHAGGMTLLPELAVAGLTAEERRRVRPFADPPPSREVRLVHGRAFLKRRAIEALAEELRRSAPGP